MAKDPAFLFYPTDFFMGTVELSDEQTGQYIRLMCLQHQKGHLSEAAMRSVMHGELDPLIMDKFKQDENGKYYNERWKWKFLSDAAMQNPAVKTGGLKKISPTQL